VFALKIIDYPLIILATMPYCYFIEGVQRAYSSGSQPLLIAPL
jgi:hypothetical protein